MINSFTEVKIDLNKLPTKMQIYLQTVSETYNDSHIAGLGENELNTIQPNDGDIELDTIKLAKLKHIKRIKNAFMFLTQSINAFYFFFF